MKNRIVSFFPVKRSAPGFQHARRSAALSTRCFKSPRDGCFFGFRKSWVRPGLHKFFERVLFEHIRKVRFCEFEGV
jgi:hypothetical protein